MEIRRVVLTTDFSPCARSAYARAADVARRFGAAIDLVHARANPVPYGSIGLGGAPMVLDHYHREIDKQLRLDAGGDVFDGLAVRSFLLDGYGPQAVTTFAADESADLIIQTSHGYGGFKRVLLGSFAEHVLRLSPVPVLTLKQPETDEVEIRPAFRVERVLLPYDLSPVSLAALDMARFWAGAFDAKVILLHAFWDVADLPPMRGTGIEPIPDELLAFGQEIPRRLSTDLETFAARELAGVEHEVRVLSGRPSEVISAAEVAYEADLICMATHGWTGLRHLVLGSVAEKVTRRALCPVLTVRPSAESLRQAAPASQVESML